MRKRLLIEPREPKWKKEWRCKILLSLVVSLIAIALILQTVDNDSRGNALGTYDPRTDEIWIRENLNNDLHEAVLTHELAHRAFHRVVPFWTPLRVSVAFSAFFVLTLGFFIQRRRLNYVVAGMLLFSCAHEIHAHSWAMIVHGFEANNALGLALYTGFPLILVVVTKYVQPFLNKLEDKKKHFRRIRSRFSKKKWKKVSWMLIVEYFSTIGLGFAYGLLIANPKDVVLSGGLITLSTIGFLWSVKKKRDWGVGICHVRFVHKKRGRPRKLDKK